MGGEKRYKPEPSGMEERRLGFGQSVLFVSFWARFSFVSFVFLWGVGEPYYARLGRAVDRKLVI